MFPKIITELFKKSYFPSFEEILLSQRINLFRKKNVQTILDVGANTGQYAESVLKDYDCNIISFEPMKHEYEILSNKLKLHKNWSAFNYGLGNEDCFMNINISKNSYSSSILGLKEETVNYDEAIQYVNTQKIQVAKLDSVWSDLHINSNNILLKIDTQGYEHNVIEGGKYAMHEIFGLQIEMAVVQLYKDEVLFEDMFKLIRRLGFELYIIEPGYADPHTGKLLQVEAIFFKPDRV